MKEASLVKLLSFLTTIDKAHHQRFIGLYIVYGDDLYLLFRIMRGATVSFPVEQKLKKASKKIQDASVLIIKGRCLIDTEEGPLSAGDLKKGKIFKHEEISYKCLASPVFIQDLYMILVAKYSVI